MPRALEPGLQFPVWLDSDAKKPEGQRPQFIYRALNGREWRLMASAMERYDSFENSGEALDMIFDVVKTGLVDWKNIKDPKTKKAIPFKPEDIDLILDPHEATEIIRKLLAAGTVSPVDKKKLG